MATDIDRRKFLTRDIWRGTARILHELTGSEKDEISSGNEIDYFASFENCYPLISESGEMLIEEAIKKGIEIEGKSKLEIAKALFKSMEKTGE